MPNRALRPFVSSSRKTPRKRPITTATLLLLALASLHETRAANVVWDPLHTGTGSDGGGAWNTTTANWAVSGADTAWTNSFANTAVFGSGGTAGAVSLATGIQANGLTFNSASSGSYTLSGGLLTLGGATPTITTNADALLTATLNGSGLSLTKTGSAKLTIDGATTSVPQINVTAGTLATTTGGTGAFGNSTTALNFSAGTTMQTTGSITVPNAITFNGGTNAAVIGGATLSGALSLASGDSTFTTSTAATLTGNITGDGSLTKMGSQKLTLTGTNSYTGTTTITGGAIQVGNGGTTGTLGSGAVVNNGVLSFNRSDSFTVANNISGAGSLTKAGAGTMHLTGSSTYTGATTVSAGTLDVTGTLVSGSAGQVIIGTGAMLTGTGTITGANAGTLTIMTGAKMAPGLLGVIGTLNATSFNWTSDSVTAGMIFDLSDVDTTSDLVALTGSFVRASTSATYIFDFQDSGVLGNTYTLFTYGSTTSTNASTFAATNLPDGLSAQFTMTSTSLKVTVVPEPTTAVSLISGLGLLGLLRRPRRSSAAFRSTL